MNKNPLTLFQDGDGNYSMMRVTMLLTLLAVIGSKFYNAHLTGQPIAWTLQDLGIFSALIGGKLVQNSQENSVQPSTPSQNEK